jgi:hypothetical protein
MCITWLKRPCELGRDYTIVNVLFHTLFPHLCGHMCTVSIGSQEDVMRVHEGRQLLFEQLNHACHEITRHPSRVSSEQHDVARQARTQCSLLMFGNHVFVHDLDQWQKFLGLGIVTNHCHMRETAAQHGPGDILCQRCCLSLLNNSRMHKHALPGYLMHPDPSLIQVHMQCPFPCF